MSVLSCSDTVLWFCFVISFRLIFTFFPFGKKETYFGKREEVFVPLPAPEWDLAPCFCWGRMLLETGRLVLWCSFRPSFFMFGGIGAALFASVARMTCPMSLLSGVFGWKKPIPAALRRGRQSPRAGFRYPLACLPTDSPSDGDSMGSAGGWVELFRRLRWPCPP